MRIPEVVARSLSLEHTDYRPLYILLSTSNANIRRSQELCDAR
jgi:hypothetical protein